MRTKLLSAVLLASTALTGVASADPVIRDHRYQQQPRYQQAQPRYQQAQPRYQQAQRYDYERDYDRNRDRDRDHDGDRDRDRDRIRVQVRPTWMPQVNYGFQVSAGNVVDPYSYGNDPYVEGIDRNQWMTIVNDMRLPTDRQSQVTVNLSGQRLQSIELQSEGGQSWISGVWVFMNDGTRFPISVARYVDSSQPNLRLDLGPNAASGVRAIQIAGFSHAGGAFDIIGA